MSPLHYFTAMLLLSKSRASDSGYDNVTGLLTVPVIESGESFVFTITLKAVTNGTLSNVVNVTSAENDTVVPPLISKRLYENCEAEGVEEVIIENGTHGRNLNADKESYWANIDMFVLNNIGN